VGLLNDHQYRLDKDKLMTTTDHGFYYPTSGSPVQIPEDIQLLAESVETRFDTDEAFTSWTPTWPGGGLGGITSVGGSGQNQGFYQQIGKLVFAQFRIELASGFSFFGSTFEMALPVAAYVGWGGAGNQAALGSWTMRDDSVPDHYAGTLGLAGPSGTACHFNGAWDGTSPKKRLTSTAGVPITYAAGDVISGVLNYRAA
jgi:hypothetical protein